MSKSNSDTLFAPESPDRIFLSTDRMGKFVHSKINKNDIRYNRSVKINFKDGSNMFFNNAFLARYKDIIFWFTQNHGWGFSTKESLESFKELTSKNIPIEEFENIINSVSENDL